MAPLSKLWCQACGEVADHRDQSMTWWVCSIECAVKFGREEATEVTKQKVQILRRPVEIPFGVGHGRKYGAKHGWHS